MTGHSNKSIQTPLARAKGLGSAKDGVHHWWVQRLTAVALVPLLLWLTYSVACLTRAGVGFTEVQDWVAQPLNTVLLLIALPVAFYHSALGLQVVIEDYIHGKGLKFASLILVKLGLFSLAVFSIYAVLKISLV